MDGGRFLSERRGSKDREEVGSSFFQFTESKWRGRGWGEKTSLGFPLGQQAKELE